MYFSMEMDDKLWKHYSCSDIIIDGKKLDSCRAQCLNGGSCFNGICLCPNGFSGEFCEDLDNEGRGWLIFSLEY